MGAQTGVRFFPIEPVSLGAGLGWLWSTQTQDSPAATSRGSSLAATAGVSIYLGGGR